MSDPAAFLPVLPALLAALVLRLAPAGRGARAWAGALLPAVALVPLAWAIAAPGRIALPGAALLAALVVALLARDRADTAQSECALKLTWVLAAAFALTWAGDSLLTIASGSAVPREQWPALALHLDPFALWTSALALTLLAGVVLLGGAPFHFWLADVLHGAPAWLAPLAAAALQACGAALLTQRLASLGTFAPGLALARGVLALAAALALVGGAATLAGQRRPERRVGSLAGLQGGLVLAALAAGGGAAPGAPLPAWPAHLALALAGAGTLARFLAVGAALDEPAPVLARRHPWSAAAGAYALLSLAGVPGTPGAALWLAVARALAATHHVPLLAALALAWLTAFAVAVREVRRAFGAFAPGPPPASAVPWPARAALWCGAAGLVGLALRLVRP